LGALAQPGQVFALVGPLGAGKTRWAQGFGLGLDVPADVVINSPTFTFVNQYEGRLTLYHIDLYRLTNAPEAETLALDDYFYGDGVCIVEWANRITTALPPERLEVELYHLEETKRRIVMRACGSAYGKMLDQFRDQVFKS
jgi:tRNA threonylcarbamoyladenosine biosynthesis protein TsaE